VRDYLRRLGVALVESAVILVALSALYILGYLAFHQTLPRWK
jgi:hypothetical protein